MCFVNRLLVTLTVLLATLSLTAGANAVSGKTPALRVASASPLTVRGTGFKRLEPVRVTDVGRERTWTRNVRASGTGTFLATFAAIESRCAVVSFRAVGSYASRAQLKLVQPGCPEPIP